MMGDDNLPLYNYHLMMNKHRQYIVKQRVKQQQLC